MSLLIDGIKMEFASFKEARQFIAMAYFIGKLSFEEADELMADTWSRMEEANGSD